MKWENLLKLVGDEPLFTSSLLRVGDVSRAKIELQLARWVKAGKVTQLRRGLYVLATPYRKTHPHPFLIANCLKGASYVSLQSALAHHGMIPEHVPVVTSVTAGRPEKLSTPFGRFFFRHMTTALFGGFQQIEVAATQSAFVALPEKALLDLVYFNPGGDKQSFLKELRLQNLDVLDQNTLREMAERTGKPKLCRAAKNFRRIAAAEEYENL